MRAPHLAAAVLATGLALATAVPSNAAAPAPQVKDAVGDGNGVNGQGVVGGVGQSTAPASTTSLDIASVRWATKFTGSGKKRAATDVVITMTLAGPVAAQGQSGIWRAIWSVGDCEYFVSYSTSADADPGFDMTMCDDGITDPKHPVKATTSGSVITWTLSLKSLKSFGIKVGTPFSTLNGHTRILMGTGTTGGATIVTVDEALSNATYKVGK